MWFVLYKQCGCVYKRLAKLFALSSQKTMTFLLWRIPVKAGVKNVVLDNVEETIPLWKQRDYVVAILFDEIVIRLSLHYNKHTEGIEVFKILVIPKPII